MADLKPGWKRVKFNEVAECVNDRIDDPKTAGVERYVGLEHLDSDTLAIRRWGTPDDVESTKPRFRPGDIIFGKRRAYQRKLAVADFEGTCSAHAMVLRAKPSGVFPEFLPFFMQSNVFMERAVSISVGSLSPTINWRTLAAEGVRLAAPRGAAAPPRRNCGLLKPRAPMLTRRSALASSSWRCSRGISAREERAGTAPWTTGGRHGRLPGRPRFLVTGQSRASPTLHGSSGHAPSRSKPKYWHGGIPWIPLADIQRLGTPTISETGEDIAQLGVENSSARLLCPAP